MFLTYILYPFTAKKYHKRYGLIPRNETFVGIFGHKLYVTEVHDLAVLRKLSKKSAKPVYFHMAKALSLDTDTLSTIIQGYFLGLVDELIDVEVIAYQDVILFYPIFENHYIYLNDDEHIFQRDLAQFANRCYLSSSRFALQWENRYPSFSGIRIQSLDRINKDGVVTYEDTLKLYLTPSELAIKATQTQQGVEYELEKGVVRMENEMLESSVLLELSEIWQLERKVTPSEVFVYQKDFVQQASVAKNDVQGFVQSLENYTSENSNSYWDTGYPFATWISESILRILRGKTPLVRFYVQSSSLDYQALCQKMVERNPLLNKDDASFVIINNNEGICFLPVLEPEDLLLAQKLLQSEEFLTVSTPVKSENVVKEERVWFVETEAGESYRIIDDVNVNEEDIIRKWNESGYISVWGQYMLKRLEVQSVAYLKSLL